MESLSEAPHAQHVRLLGVLSLVIGGLLLLGALAGAAFASVVTIVPDGDAPRVLVLLTVLFLAGAAFATLWIAAGVGLLRLRGWARPLGLLVSVLSLFAFPLGTAFGIYGLWVLTRPDLAHVLAGAPARTAVG